ncbi:hypothetical protein H0H92_002648 [Tricholoma furcatifolium]|nr:hypothetical protein H0H92_002648 [Tricholoma furcatifolium]
MVSFAPFLGAAVLLSSMVSALPRPAPQDNAVSSSSTATSTTNLAAATSSTANSAATAYGSDSTSSAVYSSGAYGSYSSYGSGSYSAVTSASSTYSAASSYSTPMYGSGSTNWGSSYDDCVSQCIAQYGSPDSSYTMPTSTGQSAGSTGTGTTHTVIVAPSAGVLRYVPFAVNASVGDTIKFMWNANNHTVTKSSELLPCNKTSDAPFASGEQNQGFTFTQVVNDTNPVFFYCGTPGHCEKGMFGIINPPSAFGSATSVAASMQANPDVAAYSSYTSQQTANNLAASKWGDNIDLSGLPDWAHTAVAENVLYTRNFLAANAEVLQADGTVDLSAAGSTPLMIPQDVGAALSNAEVVASSATSEAAAPTSTTETQPTHSANAASSLATPRAFVPLLVTVAAIFIAI